MSVMKHKGHIARVDYDAEDGLFVGHIASINDVVGFHAETVTDLKAAFEEAVEDYIATCEKVGRAPKRPYSGRVMFRVSPETHASAALAAQLAGKSLNQWAEEVLRGADQIFDFTPSNKVRICSAAWARMIDSPSDGDHVHAAASRLSSTNVRFSRKSRVSSGDPILVVTTARLARSAKINALSS